MLLCLYLIFLQGIDVTLDNSDSAVSAVSADVTVSRPAPSAHFCQHPRHFLSCVEKGALEGAGAALTPVEGEGDTWTPHDAAEACRGRKEANRYKQ